ncbi:MAG: amino acid adenylation domain-containing protein [Clostridia bacterium]
MNTKENTYPLSSPQRSIFYIEKLYPNTSIGNVSATLKIENDLDLDTMEQAVNLLMKRNDALRLHVKEVEGEPLQYISAPTHYKLDFFDFRNQPIERVYEWDKRESVIPIPLGENDLFYFALIKYGDNKSGFFARIHHIISDAWSIVKIGAEVMEYYHLIKNQAPLPQEPKHSYLDFIESELEYFESEKFQKDRHFWNSKFQDTFELTVLKTRKTNYDNLKAHRKSFVVPEKLSNLVRKHCGENRTSIFTLFFSALCLYINRITNKETVTVGVPVLNRSNAKEKQTLGMFISTVPLSIKIDNELDFIAFSQQISAEWMSVLRHQKFPYDEILKGIREKSKGTDKLFDIAMSYQNAKFSKEDTVDEQEGRWHFNGYQTEGLYIHINDRDDTGNIIMNYDYLIEIFYPKEIEFIHDHIIRLLWHALDNPLRKLPYIHIMSEVERNKLLLEFNDTLVHFPRSKTIHQLFEEQVKKTPDRIALVFENTEVTYTELNQKANQLAYYLREKGVNPDTIVGIMMQRTPEMIVGILGILKSGGCYLPIDPDYPEDRTKYMLEDSKTKYLLVHDETADLRPFQGALININDPAIGQLSCENIENLNKPNDLIYVMYTSGSTGKPKGVMIEHKNIVPLMKNDGFVFQIDEQDVWALSHSICFDVSVWEMYGALLYGGSLVIISKNTSKDPKAFLDVLKQKKVTVLNQIPVSFYNMINEEIKTTKKNLVLRYVLFAGESLKPVMLKSFIKKYPETKLFNMYGITETSVVDTFKEITEEEVRLNTNNIGKPLPTVSLYILDKNLNLVPIGVMGELCVGGEGLSRGYLHKPELTKERFVPNPFKEDELIYRSGDYARWFPKGDIEYLGRMDNQVKIRGFRIELGEIEKHLLLFPGIEKAAVIARDDAFEKRYLCAYYVSQTPLSVSDLKEYLLQVLPNFMVPSHFVQMESLPLTASGKVSLKSLPEPKISSKEKYIEPRNQMEQTVANIWGEILNIKRVGIDDNFFELGGDSLGTVQFLSTLYKHSMFAQIQDIYEHPTIRALSQKITLSEIKDEIYEADQNIDRSTLDASTSEHVKIESRPIVDLILEGELPQIDSVALSYIPEDFVLMHDADKTKKLRSEFGDKPILYHSIMNDVGHIGLMILPMLSNTLYAEKEVLLQQSLEAVQLAESLGAKIVSLTGLIPSATNYGKDIVALCATHCPGIKVTTGHTTTAASVILSIKRMLHDGSRNIQAERLCVLGLGSIGTTVIKLLLSVLPHPAAINLCDIEEKETYLRALSEELKEEFGFKNTITISLSQGIKVPDEIYENTMFIGATNVPNVLAVNRFQPGTMIIDDSGPHCFSKEEAIQRLQRAGDILFTEGGVLESPKELNKLTFLPQTMSPAYLNKYKQHFLSGKEITGCIYSSLLSAKYMNLKPSVGTAEIKDCYLHYQKLNQLGLKGAHLHCDDYIIPNQYINKFKQEFGV